MAIVIPFRGVLYDPKKVGNFNRVTAPPYDIISSEQQEGYYQNNPHNVIRLILGKQFPDDSESNNRYTRASDFFKQWQNESLLKRDEGPAFYFYHQEFYTPDKKRCSRDGFIGLVRLEDKDKGVIIPHEKTLDKPKEDRLKLMKASSAHFSSIFSLFSDPEDSLIQLLKGVVDAAPLLEATDEEGTLHQLWRVSQREIIAEVTQSMHDQSLFIADGHHRYETALNYRDYQISHNPQTTGKESYNYVMMYLTSMEGSGLLILPYHRVIHNIENFNFNSFESRLKDYFLVTSFPFNHENQEEVWDRFNKALQESGSTLPAFGMCGLGQTSFHLLRLKENVFHSLADDEETSAVLKKLDVNVIESFIFKNVLGITSKDLQQQENISYVHDSREGFELVKTKGYQLAFLLNPTKSSEIRDIAGRGETMPQKSTFFYPKLLSGFVINKIVPDELFESPWV
jgi:uncharacterized protein (DUF1015 family)